MGVIAAQPDQRYNPNAPFRSPLHAIRTAFAIEANDVVEVSAFLSDLRGGSVRLPTEMGIGGPYERHAQAALVLAFINMRLAPEDALLIRAKYTVPQGPMLERRKRADVKLMYEVLIQANPDLRRIPIKYVEDVLRGWAGYQSQRDEEGWARKLGVHTETLRRWRNGRRRRGGFVAWLRVRHDDIISLLADAMFDANITRE